MRRDTFAVLWLIITSRSSTWAGGWGEAHTPAAAAAATSSRHSPARARRAPTRGNETASLTRLFSCEGTKLGGCAYAPCRTHPCFGGRHSIQESLCYYQTKLPPTASSLWSIRKDVLSPVVKGPIDSRNLEMLLLNSVDACAASRLGRSVYPTHVTPCAGEGAVHSGIKGRLGSRADGQLARLHAHAAHIVKGHAAPLREAIPKGKPHHRLPLLVWPLQGLHTSADAVHDPRICLQLHQNRLGSSRLPTLCTTTCPGTVVSTLPPASAARVDGDGAWLHGLDHRARDQDRRTLAGDERCADEDVNLLALLRKQGHLRRRGSSSGNSIDKTHQIPLQQYWASGNGPGTALLVKTGKAQTCRDPERRETHARPLDRRHRQSNPPRPR